MWFRNRQVYIHTDLKWSSQHQSGREMPKLAADWPGHTLRGPKGPKVAQTGLSLVIWTLQGPVRASWGQSVTAETTSGHYQYDFGMKISQSPNITPCSCYITSPPHPRWYRTRYRGPVRGWPRPQGDLWSYRGTSSTSRTNSHHGTQHRIF